MRQLIWEKAFARTLKRTIRKQPTLRNEFEQTLNLLQQDVFAPSLETHKLKGNLAVSGPVVLDTPSVLSSTLLRPKAREKMIFGYSKIGTHDEVY
jgi:mRNA-degrading endonuclease YafQ of YafQ-DinJ toxin-antitoxin module